MKQYCVLPYDEGYFVASGLVDSHNVYDPDKRMYVTSHDELVSFFSDLPNKKTIVHIHDSLSCDLERKINESHGKISVNRVASFKHVDSKK